MRRSWWTWLWLLVVPFAARAEDSNLQYRLTDVVIAGTPAKMTLFASDDVSQVQVTLTPAKGKARKFGVGRLGGGEQRELDFQVPKGESRWKAALSWVEGTTKRTADVELTVQSLDPFDVQVHKHDVSLDEGKALARPNRALASAEIVVRDCSGNVLVERAVDVVEAAPGQPVELRWDTPEGSEACIADFKFVDQYTFWAAVRAVAISLDIPHEDVVFETAKWDVRSDEAPKLDAAIGEVRARLARFQRDLGRAGIKDVDASVYVAGYTDTVGGTGDNMALSEKRARAIAEYFKSHGIALPVYYQGFGEAALAVPTADETDEARNRRAAYILASAPPSGKDFPGASWKRLH